MVTALQKAQELSAAGWKVHPSGMWVSPMLCLVPSVDRAYEVYWRMTNGKKGVNRG